MAFRDTPTTVSVDSTTVTDAIAPEVREPIGTLLRRRAQAMGDRVCCAMDDEVFTFAEMNARSDALAAGLASLGVVKGDRVATLATNRSELLELFYGLAKTGAAQVPLNAYLRGDFLRYQLAHSRASVLIADAAGRDSVVPLLSKLPDLKVIVTLDEAGDGEVSYRSLLQAGETPPDVALTAADVMSIVYTSGTTGMPKGCIASHGYYCRSGQVIGDALEITDDDVVFHALPLFHSGGRLAGVAVPLVHAVPVHIRTSFSARGFFPQARAVGATLMIAVGPIGAAILATEASPADRDHMVRRIMCAPLSVDAQAQFRERFRVEPWVDIFGQSEVMPVTLTGLSSGARDPAGCGIAAPDLEVALLDDHCDVIEGAGPGEICVRPKRRFSMFDGYFERPEDTLSSYRGLWYHTGDYGRRLPSGAFAFVDRKKDALRRRGENVSSLELEAAIDTHPQIRECAVHALPSELGEDDIKVCLVLIQGATFDPAALFAFFTDHLPYFAIPRYVDVVDALPRNGIGRVMKHKLREAGNTSATIDFEALGLVVARSQRR